MTPPPVIWTPMPDSARTTAMAGFTGALENWAGREFPDYAALHSYSVEDLPGFWSAVADYFQIRWHRHPDGVLPVQVMPGADWFPGGTLNYAEHALRTPPGADDDHTAVISIAEDGTEISLTLAELRGQVGAFQAGLRRLGVSAGDRVVNLVPNTVHALIGFLATASLGAVWSSCSPDFGSTSLLDRFTQVEPTVLIAVDGYRYGGKEFHIADTVRQLRDALPSLTRVIHIPDLHTPTPEGMTDWHELTAQPADPQFTPVPFSAPLWILYSSGTTGPPKPIVHSVGGIVLEHLKSLGLHWDLKCNDRFLWFTTTGWMMWNFLIGGLLVGSTVLLYDGSPANPDLTTLWRIVDRHRVTVFGVSAAYVTACRKAEVHPGQHQDLTSLRTIGSTGSPLDDDGFDWLIQNVGDQVQIVSFSGGTDLCTGIVGGAPTVPVWKGEISCRALGAAVQSYSPGGQPLVDQVGELVITQPMPSMPVYFWGDTDGSRLGDSYFADYPGVWRHGDWIRITSRGSCIIDGRSDATLNRGGIRMGTAEFYRIVDPLPSVIDSLVIDTSTAADEGDLLLFVVLTPDAETESTAQQLRTLIRSELTPRHVPGQIIHLPSLPRTLNGKKCEVPIKRILTGTPPDQAISRDALADPTALDSFLQLSLEPRS
ncbi:acetoacetate--CoA ligase [Nakamurella sp. GG22]